MFSSTYNVPPAVKLEADVIVPSPDVDMFTVVDSDPVIATPVEDVSSFLLLS